MHDLDTGDLEHEAVVGRTSTTVVHRVRAAGVDSPIAVKHPARHGTLSNAVLRRFQNEAEQWARLDDHPNVVDVVDWGFDALPWVRDDAPLPWIAMEYLDGGDLQSVRGEMTVERALWTAKRVSDAVWNAHGYGVVHLDLKPANILFASRDDWDAPKVADWELSRSLLNSADGVGVTTPRYSAPEQVREGVSDKRTDQFQLGIVLYELFTGEYPFVENPSSVPEKTLTDAIEEADPTPPSEVDPTLPAELDGVLSRALAKDPANRYEAMLDLRRAFDALEERVGGSGTAAGGGATVRAVPGTNLGITGESGTDTGGDARDVDADSGIDGVESGMESDTSTGAATADVAVTETDTGDSTESDSGAVESETDRAAGGVERETDAATRVEASDATATGGDDEASADASWFEPSAYPEVSQRGLAAALRAEHGRPDAPSLGDALEALERQSLSSALSDLED